MPHPNLPHAFFDLLHATQFDQGRAPRVLWLEALFDLHLDQQFQISMDFFRQLPIHMILVEEVVPEAQ